MSKTMFMTAKREPEIPEPDWDWRRAHPIGSIVRLAEYTQEQGWVWKTYEVVHYFPFIVHCRDRYGFSRCFTNWEFQRRQKGTLEEKKGVPDARKVSADDN